MPIQIINKPPYIRHAAEGQSGTASLYYRKAVYLTLGNKDRALFSQRLNVINHRTTVLSDTFILNGIRVNVPFST